MAWRSPNFDFRHDPPSKSSGNVPDLDPGGVNCQSRAGARRDAWFIFSENLRNPARWHRAGAMRKFPTSQVDSTRVVGSAVVLACRVFLWSMCYGRFISITLPRCSCIMPIIYRLIVIVLNLVLYTWPVENLRIAPARRSRAGFRINFRGGEIMHRTRAARPRGFDILPSLDPD